MASQGAKNKRNGADYEIKLLNYFREHACSAERLRLAGKEDEGDLSVRASDTLPVSLVVEAKAGVNVRPRAWFNEAKVEAKKYGERRNMPRNPKPVLIMKSHNRPVGQSLVTLSLDDFTELFIRANQ